MPRISICPRTRNLAPLDSSLVFSLAMSFLRSTEFSSQTSDLTELIPSFPMRHSKRLGNPSQFRKTRHNHSHLCINHQCCQVFNPTDKHPAEIEFPSLGFSNQTGETPLRKTPVDIQRIQRKKGNSIELFCKNVSYKCSRLIHFPALYFSIGLYSAGASLTYRAGIAGSSQRPARCISFTLAPASASERAEPMRSD